MSYQTISATRPEAVLVEPRVGGMSSDVWLRRGIERDVADNGLDAGVPVEFWRAEEVHFVQEGVPSAEDMTAEFDSIWAAHERDSLTDSDLVERLQRQVDEQAAALLELGDIIGGE